jgi:hypothetical protein
MSTQDQLKQILRDAGFSGGLTKMQYEQLVQSSGLSLKHIQNLEKQFWLDNGATGTSYPQIKLSYYVDVLGCTSTNIADCEAEIAAAGISPWEPPLSAYDTLILTYSPDYYFKLDEADGASNVADSSGNEESGTVKAAAGGASVSWFSSAAAIVTDSEAGWNPTDASNGGVHFVEIDSSATYNPTELSIVLWMQGSLTNETNNPIIAKFGSDGAWMFVDSPSNTYRWLVRTPADVQKNVDLVDATLKTDGSQHLFVCTISTANNRIRLWRDNGVLVGTTALDSTGYKSTADPIVLGNYSNGTGTATAFKGLEDNVSFSPSELQQADVQAIYAAGTA